MTILQPTDFSATAEKARTLALDLKERLSAKLHLVNVQRRFEDAPPYLSQTLDGLGSDMKKRLEEVRLAEFRKLEAHLTELTPEGSTRELLWGDPVPELLGLLPRFDFAVMGAHGANRLDNLFLGGVAGRIVRRSPVPVLTVRDEAHTQEVKRILVATDFEAASKHAWAWCQRFAEADVKLVLVHVVDIVGLQNEAGYIQTVAEALQQLDGPPENRVAEQHIIQDGDPVTVLPFVAKEVHADAIAIGVRPHPAVTGLLTGSRADALVRSSPVPVLSVPLAAD